MKPKEYELWTTVQDTIGNPSQWQTEIMFVSDQKCKITFKDLVSLSVATSMDYIQTRTERQGS